MKEVDGVMHRRCAQCKIYKPLSIFDINKRTVSGYQAYCKSCRAMRYEKSKQSPLFKDVVIRHREASKRAGIKRRKQIFDAYKSGPIVMCACPGCGVVIDEFLSIDHINGGGNKHRNGGPQKVNIYSWLRKNNFPAGFQILCMNCNTAKGFYGECPHTKALRLSI